LSCILQVTARKFSQNVERTQTGGYVSVYVPNCTSLTINRYQRPYSQSVGYISCTLDSSLWRIWKIPCGPNTYMGGQHGQKSVWARAHTAHTVPAPMRGHA